MKKIAFISAFACLLSTAVSSQAQLINTFPSWDTTTALPVPFGEAGVATVGQVFTVESGYTQLDAFAFALGSAAPTGGPVVFAAFVAAWDPVNFHATGPLLFGGGPFSINASATAFAPLVVTTGGVSLTAGSQYVAFLTASLFFDGVGDLANVGFIGSDVYSGGGAAVSANGSDLTALGTTSWITSPADLVFAAAFSPSASPVPEPSTYGLFGTGLLGAAIALRKKLKRV